MKKQALLIGMAVFFGLSFFNLVLAQNGQAGFVPEGIIVSDGLKIVSRVGFENGKIISQENNRLKVSFELSNPGEPETDVRYSLRLDKKVGGDYYPVDEKIFEEVLSLVKNQTIKKEVEYVVPDFLRGEVKVWLTSKNSAGLPLGIAPLGVIFLSGTNDYIQIPNNCFLTIGNEEPKYSLLEGVSYRNNEEVFLNCQLENMSQKAISAQVIFNVYRRTVFNQNEKTTPVSSENISLGAKEKKDVKIKLPQMDKPQAYDISVSLEDNGKMVSNSMVAHAVLAGESASILTVKLDKESYQKNETANLFIKTVGSADNFPNSRTGGTEKEELVAEVEISDYLGKACAGKVMQNIPADNGNYSEMNIPVSIKENCLGMKTVVFLKNKEGKELDKKIIAFTVIGNEKVQPQVGKGMGIAKKIAWAIGILCLGVSLLAFIFYRLKNRNNSISGIVLLIIISSFFYFSDVSAATPINGACNPLRATEFSSNTGGWPSGSSYCTDGNDVDTDGFPSQGETVYWGCAGYYGGYNAFCSASRALNSTDGVCGTKSGVFPVGTLNYPTDSHYCTAGGDATSTPSFSKTGTVSWTCPGKDGGTNASCYACIVGNCATPTSGVCNTKRATTFLSTTTSWPDGLSNGSNLCTSGSPKPSTVSFPGIGNTSRWSCLGTGGGASPACAALRSAAPVNAVCGSNQKNYASADAAWVNSATSGFCSSGTKSGSPTFPSTEGTFSTWFCKGATGGEDTSCTARKANYRALTNSEYSSLPLKTNVGAQSVSLQTGDNYRATFTVSTGQWYEFGENIAVSASGQISLSCSNTAVDTTITARLQDGSMQTVFASGYTTASDDKKPLSKTVNITAPNLAGRYWLEIKIVSKYYSAGSGAQKSTKEEMALLPIYIYGVCGGSLPSGATMCSGANTSLTTAKNWTSVATCTPGNKCEYIGSSSCGCGTANTKTYTSQPGASLLCPAGVTPSSVTATATGWTWSCSKSTTTTSCTLKVGAPGTCDIATCTPASNCTTVTTTTPTCTTANCAAGRAISPGCGSCAGTNYTSSSEFWPGCGWNLCNIDATFGGDLYGGQPPFNWTCIDNSDASNIISCSTKLFTPAQCGNAHGSSTATDIAGLTTLGLCPASNALANYKYTPSSVRVVGESWEWDCVEEEIICTPFPSCSLTGNKYTAWNCQAEKAVTTLPPTCETIYPCPAQNQYCVGQKIPDGCGGISCSEGIKHCDKSPSADASLYDARCCNGGWIETKPN